MVVLIFIVHFIVISALQLLSVISQGGFTQVCLNFWECQERCYKKCIISG